MKANLANVLKEIYEGGLDEKDCAMILHKVYERLDDEFFEDPPSFEQQLTLKKLLEVSDKVECFFK